MAVVNAFSARFVKLSFFIYAVFRLKDMVDRSGEGKRKKQTTKTKSAIFGEGLETHPLKLKVSDFGPLQRKKFHPKQSLQRQGPVVAQES